MEWEIFADAALLKWKVEEHGKTGGPSGDGRVLFLPAPGKNRKWDAALGFLSSEEKRELDKFINRFDFKPKPGEILSFDRGAECRMVLAVNPELQNPFTWLGLCRKSLEPILEAKTRKLVVDLRACGEQAEWVADAVISSVLTLLFEPKNYTEEKKEKKIFPEVFFLTAGAQISRDRLEMAAAQASSTNLVRYLSGLAGNDLTPSRYVQMATALAKTHQLKSEFYSLDKLEKMKAGAFLAVSAASEDKGGGILKLTYRPQTPKRRLAFVGKGITFDTGGTQLKTGEHMFGMNGDMGGSAVVLALVLLAKKLRWPWEVVAWLAISENSIGPKAYRPNDIVKTLSGKTIEVVDSDAEGRMVLSDALHLAAQEKPDLLMDFATLTGACVRAIGTSYSGAYTNRSEWFTQVIEAGRESGERVWPFPNDPDFGTCLKSEVADIKQCRLTGGADHIEAGYFLGQFVPTTVPWVHVDLSAAEADEGLAHVPPKLTGFGVRFATEFVRRVL